MSESESGASPSTKKSGNYKIPLILGAIGLLLMISPFFYSAYVDATVGRGGPDDVSSGWAFVWALYHLTPPGPYSSRPRLHHWICADAVLYQQ